ncbi:MAG: ATP-binding protein [Eubacterium sp.]
MSTEIPITQSQSNNDYYTLSFYRALLEHPMMKSFLSLTKSYAPNINKSDFRNQHLETYYELKSQMLAYSFNKNEETNYAKSPWKDFLLTQIIGNENPLSLLFERNIVTRQHPFGKSMYHDFEILMDLYHFDWEQFLKETNLDDTNIFSAHIFFPVPPYDEINLAFETRDVHISFKATNHYIYQYGLGIFELNPSFKLGPNNRLVPIKNQKYKSMDSLVGYELQKKELLANTKAFIKNHTGLNVLLQGDMGTGKSTMVKALLNTFKDTKLKMIEIKKDQLNFIPTIINTIKNRPYPFILFIDDLSFEKNDSAYKVFKNIIQGSLEENPQNILIYATSNKRHLVTETHSERDNAVHSKDIMEEKLSLSSRFGLVLTFTAPNQRDYLNIVNALASEAGITLPTTLIESQAIQWEMRHLNRSGRTAEQFINYLLITMDSISE